MYLNSIEKIIALLTAIIWATFTLIPNSHSLIVKWGWVFVWQIGLLLPLIWRLLIWQRRSIFSKINRNNLEILILGVLLFAGIFIPSCFAIFPKQAYWNQLAFTCLLLCFSAILNSLKSYHQKYRLINFYGCVSFAFVVISLYVWLTNTLLPEFSRLNALNQKYNLDLKLDFSVLELRNWAPIGHQNYVAGYLLLCLPIFAGLAIINKGKQRYFWIAGLVLGSIDLYSTSSRGGWLGLAVTCIVSLAILLFKSKLSRSRSISIALGIFSLLGTFLLTNNRLLSLFSGGEFAYRWINFNIGWQMGISHLFTGVGFGGVPLLYQKYRPIWAGRESELVYQLHSTPAQLFAEMGIWGILFWVASIVFLIRLFCQISQANKYDVAEEERKLFFTNKIIDFSIFAGLLGYAVISITDYQLDNLSISGTLVIFIACLLFSNHPNIETVEAIDRKKILFKRIVSIIIVILHLVFLYPTHRAWQLSSQGFSALGEEKIDVFYNKLQESFKLAPWEAYYPYQIGWNLGNFALKTTDRQQQQQFLQTSIKWLETGNKTSPYQEFGYTNLGWLLLGNNPAAATQSFRKAAELVPAKQGIFSSIAVSLFLQKKTNLAIDAFTIELLRDPLFITSPIWQTQYLQSLYPQVVENLEQKYIELIQKYPNNSYWKTCLTGLHWWEGKIDLVRKEISNSPNPLLDIIVNLDDRKNIIDKLAELPDSHTKLIITAWLEPQQRSELLQKAWVLARNEEIKPEILQQHLESMAKSATISQWLRKNAPSWTFRKERQGFGIVSRHLDGATPIDFNQITENMPMEIWFSTLFPSPVYAPEIDLSLQEWRVKLLNNLGTN
jgi:uncharacterized protein involved in response to NO